MEKQSLKKFTIKRQSKLQNIPTIITDEYIQNMLDNNMFANWGFSYMDLSGKDLSKVSIEILSKVAFSSSTIWPNIDKLPPNFNPKEILHQTTQTSKEIKLLHDNNINGDGIILAVIDNNFQGANHIEFENSKLIKATLKSANLGDYHFHMEDVLAKLCGKKLGIAPKSKVLYYEVSDEEDCSFDVLNALKDIKNRIIQGEEIRIVNFSYSLTNEESPFEFEKECLAIVEELRNLKCEVIDSTRFGENFFCCGTTFLNESDDKNKYHIASFAQGKPYEKLTKDKINILCSGRTLPEFCNENGYKYEAVDCFSWTIPQCVGLYALCLQINPELNFKQFTSQCMKSCEKNSNNMSILNAEQLIKNVKQNYLDTQGKLCKS